MDYIQLDNEGYRHIDDAHHDCVLLQVRMDMVTNGGRKWYYYDASKPWKGGYWTPLLPSAPPYNEYEWNPKTCRFEHKETGRTAVLMAEAGKKTKGQETTYQEEVPRMVEILV